MVLHPSLILIACELRVACITPATSEPTPSPPGGPQPATTSSCTQGPSVVVRGVKPRKPIGPKASPYTCCACRLCNSGRSLGLLASWSGPAGSVCCDVTCGHAVPALLRVWDFEHPAVPPAVHPCKEMEQHLCGRYQTPPCQPTTHYYPYKHTRSLHGTALEPALATYSSTPVTTHGTQALVQAHCDQPGAMPSCTTPCSLCPALFPLLFPPCALRPIPYLPRYSIYSYFQSAGYICTLSRERFCSPSVKRPLLPSCCSRWVWEIKPPLLLPTAVPLPHA